MRSEIVKNQERQIWMLRIEAQVESGLTQGEWCERENVSISALRYWITKFNKEKSSEETSQWLKVNVNDLHVAQLAVADSDPAPKSEINVKYGGFTVELSGGCIPEKVYEVLKILKAIC